METYRVKLQEGETTETIEVEANGVESAKKRARVGRMYAEVMAVEDSEGTVLYENVENGSEPLAAEQPQRVEQSRTVSRIEEPPAVTTVLNAAGWVVIAIAVLTAIVVLGKYNAVLSGLYTAGAGIVSGSLLIAAAQGLSYLKLIYSELKENR